MHTVALHVQESLIVKRVVSFGQFNAIMQSATMDIAAQYRRRFLSSLFFCCFYCQIQLNSFSFDHFALSANFFVLCNESDDFG